MEELYNEIGYHGIDYLMAQFQTADTSDVPINTSESTYYSAKIAWGNMVGKVTDQADLMDYLVKFKEEIEEETMGKISSVLKYKGTVDKVADLPTNAEIGDCYNVRETGANYAWNGTEWDKLSETIDLSAFLKKTDFELAIASYYMKSEVDLKLEELDSALQGKIKANSDRLDILEPALENKADTSYVIELNNAVVDGINAEIEARKKAVSDLAEKIDIAVTQDDLKAVEDKLEAHIEDAEAHSATKEDLTNYYTKSETDIKIGELTEDKADKDTVFTKDEIAELLAGKEDADENIVKYTDGAIKADKLLDKDGNRLIEITEDGITLGSENIHLNLDSVDDITINGGVVATTQYVDDSVDAAKVELNGNIETAKTELQGEISEAKTELNGNINTAKTELSSAIEQAKTDLNAAIEAVKEEAKGDTEAIEEIETALETVQGEITQTKTDLQAEIGQAKTDLQGEITTAVEGMQADLAQAKEDMSADLEQAKTDLNTALDTAKAEMVEEQGKFEDKIDTEIAEIKSSITAALHYKGSVATYDDLPTDAKVGDLYNVLDTGANYAWTGTEWDRMSEIIDLSPYYTKEECEEQFASHEQLDTLQEQVDDTLAHQSGNIQALLLKIAELEQKILDVRSLDPEVIVLYEGGQTEYQNKEKDFMLSGAVNTTTTVIGNSVTLKEVTLNAASVGMLAAQDIMVKETTMTGSVRRTTSPYIVGVNADGYITVKDCTLNPESAYNGVSVCDDMTLAKSVTIDNVDFAGHLINHGISIYGMADNGVVTISNCHFHDLSNVLRLSNRDNVAYTVNIINCTCDKWATGEYAGMILLQDDTSGSASAADTNNIFKDVTINIQNVVKPDGTKIVPTDLATICGTQDDNQIIYMWDEYRGHTAYGSKYPTINII